MQATMNDANLIRVCNTNDVHDSLERTRTCSKRISRRVQNVLLIWLDKNINLKTPAYRRKITRLRQIVNGVNSFIDRQQCIDFINNITNTKICLIVSGSDGKNCVPNIHDLLQIDSIFIYCRNRNQHEQWAQMWPKIKGIYTKMQPIYAALKEAVCQCEENSMPISFVMPNKTLNHLDPSFMYTQIFKEILLTIKFEQKHMKNYLKYARHIFNKNTRELSIIQEVQKSYHDKSPIWWYTYHCFLYSMLNHSLRSLDGNTITHMGFFIGDLHRHIEQLHENQYDRSMSSDVFTVYRGQGLSKVDFETMKQTIGGLISFNNFLSTSKIHRVALDFATKTIINPDLVGIIFIMEIDPSQSRTPFASVKNISYFGDEDEILFSMHTVFRIRDIQPMEGKSRLYEVKLVLTNDKDKELCTLTNHIRKETYPLSNAWYRLGVLLFKIGQFDKAEETLKISLKQTTNYNDKGSIYHQLGRIKDAQGKYQKAIHFYKKTLKIFRKNSSFNELDLANIYNELGNSYCSMHLYSKALLSDEKALKIRERLLSFNHSDLATSHNSLGNVYSIQGDYDKALISYAKALEIYKLSLPCNHPDLAMCYMSIGNVYYSIYAYNDALSFHKEALDIKQESLPSNHYGFLSSYNNIGLVYEGMIDYVNARSFYERAVEIGQQALPLDHHNLQVCRKNLERIKQKS